MDGFRGTAAAQLEEYRLLERLLRDSVWWATRGTGAPERAMTTQGKGRCPSPSGTRRRCGDSLQSPHDPEATYSTKARGTRYVAETCHAENATQLTR